MRERYSIFFSFCSRRLPIYFKPKKDLQTLPRLDLVRSSVHWRFGSGVDIPLVQKITARTPTFRPRSFRRSLALRFGSPTQGQRGLCQATIHAARNLRRSRSRLEHRPQVHVQNCAPPRLLSPKIPLRGELVWHQSTPLGGGQGLAEGRPREKVFDAPAISFCGPRGKYQVTRAGRGRIPIAHFCVGYRLKKPNAPRWVAGGTATQRVLTGGQNCLGKNCRSSGAPPR